eukprot:gene30342-39571_t
MDWYLVATKSTKQNKKTGKAVGTPKAGVKGSGQGYLIFKGEFKKTAPKGEVKEVIEPSHQMSRRAVTHVKVYNNGDVSSEDDEAKALEASARKAWKKLSEEEKQRYADLVPTRAAATTDAQVEKKPTAITTDNKSKRGPKAKISPGKAKTAKKGKVTTAAAERQSGEPLNTPTESQDEDKSVHLPIEMEAETAIDIHH